MQVLLRHLGLQDGTLLDVDPASLEGISSFQGFGSRPEFSEADNLLPGGQIGVCAPGGSVGREGGEWLVIGWWPGRGRAVPPAVDNNTALVDRNEVVRVVRPSVYVRIPERTTGTNAADSGARCS